MEMKILVNEIPKKKEDCIFSREMNYEGVSKNSYFCTLMKCGGFCPIDTHKCPMLEEHSNLKIIK